MFLPVRLTEDNIRQVLLKADWEAKTCPYCGDIAWIYHGTKANNYKNKN